jgi:membrane-associated phospholipid phosphatase
MGLFIRMTSSKPFFSDQWQLRPLIIFHAIALALLLSFVWPAGFFAWRAADEQVFFALNSSLESGGTWAWLWAWANTRYKDLALAVVMLCFLIFPKLGIPRSELQKTFIGFVVLLFLLLPLRYFFYEFSKAMDLTGPSPSRVLEPAYLLTELFPSIPAKDASSRSFPGDHATILLLWAGYLLMCSRHLMAYVAAFIATLMIFPRLVGGAHWLSDIIVGGLVIALPILAWGFYTPLLHKCTNSLAKHLQPLFHLVSRIPLLGKLAFFDASRSRD